MDLLRNLISFDEVESDSRKVSEIRKLFDPLCDTKQDNVPKLCELPHQTPNADQASPADSRVESTFEDSAIGNEEDSLDDIDRFMEIFTDNWQGAERRSHESERLFVSVTTGHCESSNQSGAGDSGLEKPVLLRRRKLSKRLNCAFLPNVQGSLELDHFVDSTECAVEQRVRIANSPSTVFDDCSQSYSPSFPVVCNPVYGNRSRASLYSNEDCTRAQLFLKREASQGWPSRSGASRVAHLVPLSSRERLDSTTPNQLKCPSGWTIPPIEVRVTTHISLLPKCTQALSDSAGSTSKPLSSVVKPSSLPRIRLVCDPHTTMVNELIMEVLANTPLPSDTYLDANLFQLRIHGRAELLNPFARLCDCDYVQVCHRLDTPIRLVLEPCSYKNTSHNQSVEDYGIFCPQTCVLQSSSHSRNEEEIFITYSIFQNSIAKLRTVLSNTCSGPVLDKWITEVQHVSSSLAQSIKAVLAVVCQSIAFTDVLNALGRVQISLKEALSDLNLGGHVGILKNNSTAGFASSCRETKSTKTRTPVLPKIASYCGMSSTPISGRSLAKLDRDLFSLEHNLLTQLGAFFDWRQIAVHVNPTVLSTCLRQSRTDRPQGVVLDKGIVSQVEPETARVTRNAETCVDPFTVGLVAIHRVTGIQGSLSPAYQEAIFQNRSPGAGQISQENDPQSRHRSHTHFTVILTLLYAGRRLGQVYPQDHSAYTADPRSVTNSGWTARDSFISDPGRLQTIQPGFPKVLQFEQWFKYSAFCLNQLPRETLLSVSLVVRKKHPTENSAEPILLGWVNVPLFRADGFLFQGTVVAGLWPADDVLHEFRSTWSQPNRSADCPVVQLSFPEYIHDVEFPLVTVENDDQQNPTADFSHLVAEAKQAVFYASSALLLHTLNPDVSTCSTTNCLALYSEAASATHRLNHLNRPHIKLRSLLLGALTVTPDLSAGPNSSATSLATSSDTILNTLRNPPAVAVEVLWNLRWCLCNQSDALVAFLTSVLVTWPQEAHGTGFSRNITWSWKALLRHIYDVLNRSPRLSAGLALRLLAPDVADQGIRHWAVRSLASLPTDVLLLYLPQVLEAVNHDLHLDYSGLASLLIHRSAESMRFATALYWQLNVVLQLSVTRSVPGSVSFSSADWRVNRFSVLKAALLYVAGTKMYTIWRNQERFVVFLHEAASAVKNTKGSSSAREEVLNRHLCDLMHWMHRELHSSVDQPRVNSAKRSETCATGQPVPMLLDLDDTHSSPVHQASNRSPVQRSRSPMTVSSSTTFGLHMPHNPGLLTHRLDISACTYFNSYTCPLRLVFQALDAAAEPIMVMFKAGDDLRQDTLITQFTFLMDRIWLDSGLDLRMINFRILPTGDRCGLIELVSECCTLRQIQQQGGGLTGPFKDSVITTWLQSQNTTELDYKRALDNFLHSLAGCCVMTYVLGIGDRHNDNIMIRYSGHLFHVDFAKVFGNAQTFAGIKRDRVPFVLTSDMLHVLQSYSKEMDDQGGSSSGFGKSSANASPMKYAPNRDGVQLFVDYCCEAYNSLRKQTYALISILERGLSMNIPSVTIESVRFVLRALQPDLSEQQASQHFTELIHKALQSKMPALNFFVHGLAQSKQPSMAGGNSTTNVTSPTPVSSSFSTIPRSDSLNLFRGSGSVNNPSLRSGHTGQILSLSPKRFSFSDDGFIEAVVVGSAVKKRSCEKTSDHYFPMSVWRKDCRVPTRVYRRLSDLTELCIALRETYCCPTTAQTVHALQHSINSGSVTSVNTQNRVQELVDYLLEEDETISKSDLMCTFFHSLLFDEKFSTEEGIQLTNGLQPSARSPSQPAQPNVASSEWDPSILATTVNMNNMLADSQDIGSGLRFGDHLPALELQFFLSENVRKLDVMIKYGRGLRIPGSNDPPDVYVKVYLLAGRRKKTTKRKTSVMRHSSSPSFNTTFTYELSTHDIQSGFLEVSAWHVVNLGENLSLGQVYVQLRSLRPGICTTKWYILSSDGQMV